VTAAPAAATVIMACRNGEPHLREALEAVAAQVWDRPWEFIFVDNGSTDGSRATFDAVAARHPGVRMRAVDASDRAGKSHALNRGVGEARSDVLVMVDADDVPAPGWLAAMAEALTQHDFVSARIEVRRLNGGPAGLYRKVREQGIWPLHFAPYGLCAAGATMGMTRRLFDAVGGFDPDFQPEDTEFCIRAHLEGFTLQPAPGAVVHYRFRSDLRGIYRQAYSYARTHVKIARAYADTGPPQRDRWRLLARNLRKNLRAYLAWRLGRGPQSEADVAAMHWRLGKSMGQVAGVLRHWAPPTCGTPPEPRVPSPALD
jgi:cellulose synthase/poly-beta-1,6-N-acetylglucosamine synthase-like glycosyltransferase